MFGPPDSVPQILTALGLKIDIFPALSVQAQVYNESLEWLQFAFAGDRTGAYIPPVETESSRLHMVEGGFLFALYLLRLQRSFLGT